jgi:hypothetical protein
VTLSEFCAEYRVSRSSASAQLGAGLLKATRTGRQTYIERLEAERWLREDRYRVRLRNPMWPEHPGVVLLNSEVRSVLVGRIRADRRSRVDLLSRLGDLGLEFRVEFCRGAMVYHLSSRAELIIEGEAHPLPTVTSNL